MSYKIKQLYIIYDENAFIIIERVNIDDEFDIIKEQVEFIELRANLEVFAKQLLTEGLLLNFQRSVYVINGINHQCIIVQGSEITPPVPLGVIRDLNYDNNLPAASDIVVLSKFSTTNASNLIIAAGPIQNAGIAYVKANENGIIWYFFGNGATLTTGLSIRVNYYSGAIVVYTVVVNTGQPVVLPIGLIASVDKIEIVAGATAPPPITTGAFSINATGGFFVESISGITNNISYPVANSLANGTWTSYGGGNITVNVMTSNICNLRMVVAGSSSNITPVNGSGTYIITNVPPPANGNAIQIQFFN